jgi:hypothetical protein
MMDDAFPAGRQNFWKSNFLKGLAPKPSTSSSTTSKGALAVLAVPSSSSAAQ